MNLLDKIKAKLHRHKWIRERADTGDNIVEYEKCAICKRIQNEVVTKKAIKHEF